MKKTLVLSRHTIRNLTVGQLGNARGGAAGSGDTCYCNERTEDCACYPGTSKERQSEWVGKVFVAC